MRAADLYYYEHPGVAMTLPVLRLRAGPLLAYADPVSGVLLRRYHRSGRLERWLYHGLHSWDVPPLVDDEGRWRGALLGMLLLSGLVLGSGLWLQFGRRAQRRGAERQSPS